MVCFRVQDCANCAIFKKIPFKITVVIKTQKIYAIGRGYILYFTRETGGI